MAIVYQNGPVQEQGSNGAQVENLLKAARERLEFLNSAAQGQFACQENAADIAAIRQAEEMLRQRAAARRQRGMEGASQV